MVSLRNLNTIAVLDGQTLAVKWSMTGPALRQHDPDFLPNGHLLDVRQPQGWHPHESGSSRILEIDPVTRRILWTFTGTTEEPFYTDARGKVELLANGNVLVTEAQAGRVFEVARTAEGGLDRCRVGQRRRARAAPATSPRQTDPAERVGFLDEGSRPRRRRQGRRGYAASPRVNCSSARRA